MKTLRVRKFMVVGMISLIIVPMLVYLAVHVIGQRTLPPWSQAQDQKQEVAIQQTINRVVTSSNKWTDPTWQSELQKQLHQSGMEVVILSPSDHEIFDSGYLHGRHWMSSNTTTVVNGGHVVGTVKVYAPGPNDPVADVSAFVAMLCVIFWVGFQMQRSVVRPLEAMSRAARLIAEGDFDIELPISRVTEIEQVRTGFEVMVTGLGESFQKQAELAEERRFFMGAVAHDLRTPLFALRGYLDGLEQGIARTPDKVAKYVAVCIDKASQLDRLVADLFAFTKLEYMEQTLHVDDVDVTRVVERSVDNLRPQAQDKGVSIVLENPEQTCVARLDSHLLERAVINLLDNALRHTPAGGQICIRWNNESERTWISVRDTGSGFASHDLSHVFEPLYRGEASRNRATGGAGLGLTIAKRIFKAHGGELVAENHPDGGALLVGWIPRGSC
ncbi:sensor histidine kinase [Alicyclobacillus fastidiosus]|uniref:histidine kinase n=1 Tax=Alicyclobacillus fastidiosus TaxID=392011 RepID=A0ABV5AHS4_9BACL|nr:HAMP domain-containing sensor histidine kinase [Alicyclobacillus fastidiosus]WEH07952.1 HAMP domain-containing sensor histidine kinase [Alicyclobacillus fastidiosus]